MNKKIIYSKLNILEANKEKSLFKLLKPLRKVGFSLIKMNQTHSSNVKTITIIEQKKTILTLPNTDACISNLKKTLLVVKTADCVPIIISHKSGYFATIHAGRVGSEKNILKKTLRKLIKLCKSKQYFDIWIGPHICHSCYEINSKPKKHYNLLKENLNQIYSLLGKENNNIIKEQLCTSCDNDKYFSYRKNNKTKKRNYFLCFLT